VDFVIEREGSLLPVEVKSALREPKLTRSFMNFLDEYKPKRGLVVSSNLVARRKVGAASIEFLPLFAAGNVLN